MGQNRACAWWLCPSLPGADITNQPWHLSHPVFILLEILCSGLQGEAGVSSGWNPLDHPRCGESMRCPAEGPPDCPVLDLRTQAGQCALTQAQKQSGNAGFAPGSCLNNFLSSPYPFPTYAHPVLSPSSKCLAPHTIVTQLYLRTVPAQNRLTLHTGSCSIPTPQVP